MATHNETVSKISNLKLKIAELKLKIEKRFVRLEVLMSIMMAILVIPILKDLFL